MMQYLTTLIPSLRKYRRKSLHKTYVYETMLQLRNEAVQLYLNLDLPEFKVKPRVTPTDRHKIILAKKKMSLARKYKRRLLLLEF